MLHMKTAAFSPSYNECQKLWSDTSFKSYFTLHYTDINTTTWTAALFLHWDYGCARPSGEKTELQAVGPMGG